jgi:hypothetical protein
VANNPVGQGIMDWAPIFACAKQIETVFVEMDSCAIDTLAAVEASAQYLISKNFAK